MNIPQKLVKSATIGNERSGVAEKRRTQNGMVQPRLSFIAATSCQYQTVQTCARCKPSTASGGILLIYSTPLVHLQPIVGAASVADLILSHPYHLFQRLQVILYMFPYLSFLKLQSLAIMHRVHAEHNTAFPPSTTQGSANS
jgi:hypothetical protein